MLKILRRKGVMKKLLWFVAIIIILSFGVLGQAYLLNRNDKIDYAGKIFGKKISLDDFRTQYLHLERLARNQYGRQFNDIVQYLNLGAQTWDRIILLYEANKRKIKITDKEVVDLIRQDPSFQKDGLFNRDIYTNVLLYGLRTEERAFEEQIRNRLKLAKLFEQETADVTIQEEEVFNAYKTDNEKVQVSYVLFNNTDYKDQVEYDEIQAKNYYLANKKDFLVNPMVNVEYIKVELPEESMQEEAPAKDDTANDASSEKPETTENSTEDVDQALEKIQAVAKTLQENPDFTLAAEKHGLQVETSGFFSMEQPLLKTGWTYPILQNIFLSQPGQILGPLETLKGYQMIKVVEKKDAYIPDYPEAQDKVKEAWMENAAKVFAKEDAESKLKALHDAFEKVKHPDFAKTTKELGLEIAQTPVFNRGQYLPEIGISRDFQETAFALNKESPLSDVVETQKGYCFLYLDESIEVDMDEYEKQKNEYSEKMLMEKQSEAFNDFLTLLRLKANLEDNITSQKEPKA